MDLKTKVLLKFVNNVSMQKGLSAYNAIDAIKSLLTLINEYDDLSIKEKKELLVSLLEDIASGKDGVLDTADDVLPYFVVDGIRLLIDTNLIPSVIDLVCQSVHLKTGKTVCNVFVALITSIFSCCCSRKKQKDNLLLD
jgi:hypothetical protein